MKPNRLYTVMIIPHSEKEPITLQIPLLWIQSFFIVLAISFFMFLIGILQYMDYKKDVQELKYYAVEVNKMKREFAQVSGDLIQLQQLLNEMKTVEEKIRTQAKLESVSTPASIQLTAVGGPSDAEAKGLKNTVVSLTIPRTKEQVDQLLAETPAQLEKFEHLLIQIEDKNEKLAAIPSIYPSYGRITSIFGYRKDPFTRRSAFHRGMDIANRPNTPVYATANGTVTHAKYNGGHGKQVAINHRNGIVTTYSHLRKYVIEAGEQVEKGQLIGYMGTTGRSTGTHLHYEIVINGKPVNPANYLPY
jgi:murein DD-endopeptidase MepM/ murein hydrolase activator NlpD